MFSVWGYLKTGMSLELMLLKEMLLELILKKLLVKL